MHATLALADLEGDTTLPIYQRIKNTIQSKIQKGEWPPGTKIPSENQLAADLNVSRMTINRPFSELSAEGVLTYLTYPSSRYNLSARYKPQRVSTS